MRRNSLWIKVTAATFAFALIGAACSSDPSENASASTDSSDAAEQVAEVDDAPSVDNPATNLTRDLTSLLAGHEYHAGLAVLTAVQAGGDLEDKTFQAAAGALDDNSQALAGAIGSVYGPDAEDAFLKLWRAHIGFFVDYTLGKATGNDKMVAKAEKDLDGYRNDFGALIEGATEGGLTADQVADALTVHVTSTFDAIDAVVASDPSAFSKLQDAAGHLPHIASVLSGAIVAQYPEKF